MALVINGHEACELHSLSGWDIEVTDQTGQTVLTIPVSNGQRMSMRQAA
jgi:hypothetical protein